jgi:uncharacterized protein YdhG (YjbR/CyaY superfamily)
VPHHQAEDDMAASTVDDYLAEVPEPHRTTLRKLRETLRSLLPDAKEELSYGVPAFKVNGKAVAGYAAFKNHCSYFPHSGSILSQMADDVTAYTWSKGTLQFPADHPPPADLVRRLVELRLAQISR